MVEIQTDLPGCEHKDKTVSLSVSLAGPSNPDRDKRLHGGRCGHLEALGLVPTVYFHFRLPSLVRPDVL